MISLNNKRAQQAAKVPAEGVRGDGEGGHLTVGGLLQFLRPYRFRVVGVANEADARRPALDLVPHHDLPGDVGHDDALEVR